MWLQRSTKIAWHFFQSSPIGPSMSAIKSSHTSEPPSNCSLVRGNSAMMQLHNLANSSYTDWPLENYCPLFCIMIQAWKDRTSIPESIPQSDVWSLKTIWSWRFITKKESIQRTRKTNYFLTWRFREMIQLTNPLVKWLLAWTSSILDIFSNLGHHGLHHEPAESICKPLSVGFLQGVAISRNLEPVHHLGTRTEVLYHQHHPHHRHQHQTNLQQTTPYHHDYQVSITTQKQCKLRIYSLSFLTQLKTENKKHDTVMLRHESVIQTQNILEMWSDSSLLSRYMILAKHNACPRRFSESLLSWKDRWTAGTPPKHPRRCIEVVITSPSNRNASAGPASEDIGQPQVSPPNGNPNRDFQNQTCLSQRRSLQTKSSCLNW